jgi:hypothetical protein
MLLQELHRPGELVHRPRRNGEGFCMIPGEGLQTTRDDQADQD